MNKPYDKNKIGKFIGWGGEHLVFEYGNNQPRTRASSGRGKVIKFSMHIWLSGQSAVEKKKKDYEIGKKYFGEYLLPVEIKTWKKGKKAVEIQDKIQCYFLKKKDLGNDKIKKQFNDIMHRHHKMVCDIGAPMDFIGREGLFKWWKQDEISNILVTPSPAKSLGDNGASKKLVLVDFTLLQLQPKLRELPLWFFIQWAKRKQRRLLRKFGQSSAPGPRRARQG